MGIVKDMSLVTSVLLGLVFFSCRHCVTDMSLVTTVLLGRGLFSCGHYYRHESGHSHVTGTRSFFLWYCGHCITNISLVMSVLLGLGLFLFAALWAL